MIWRWGSRSLKAEGSTPKALPSRVLPGVWRGHHSQLLLPTPVLQVPDISEALKCVTTVLGGVGEWEVAERGGVI